MTHTPEVEALVKAAQILSNVAEMGTPSSDAWERLDLALLPFRPVVKEPVPLSETVLLGWQMPRELMKNPTDYAEQGLYRVRVFHVAVKDKP